MLSFSSPGRWKNVVRLAFGPDNSALVGGCFGAGVVRWDVSSGAVRSQYRLEFGSVFGLLLPPGGEFVCVPSGYGGLVHLSYPDLRPLSPESYRPGEYVRFTALSPDGTRMLRSRFTPSGQPSAYGIALVSGAPPWEAEEWQRFEGGWAPMAGTFITANQLATADRSWARGGTSRLAIRGAATGQVTRDLVCPAKELANVAASPDARWCVLMAGRALWVWDGTDWGAGPKKLPSDTRFHFTGIAFHPSGRFLAATSNDATVKLYDTTTWDVARTFTWDIGRMRSIAFSPDGTLAAAGSDTGKVVVWDVDL